MSNISTKDKLTLWFNILDTLTPNDWGDMENDTNAILIEAGRQYRDLLDKLTNN